jgi:hypothetical protein
LRPESVGFFNCPSESPDEGNHEGRAVEGLMEPEKYWYVWIGPGPNDSVVLCILTRHIVETHPNTAHATTLRFNAVQLGGSANPDDWCRHDPEQHRRVMVLEPTS